VMDTTAISLCMENALPIIVFDLTRSGNIKRIVLGEPVGSIVSAEGRVGVSRSATALPGRDERWGLGGHVGAPM